MQRFARRLALLWVVAASACAADSEVGAVVVRWRLLDGASGQLSGCTVGAAGSSLTVEQIALEISQLDGTPVTCDSCVFTCGPLEGTTRFSIRANQSYLFRLRALSCGQPVGDSPPPVVRNVKPGEVTNLNAVEILIPPCEHPRCDGGAAQGATCDAF